MIRRVKGVGSFFSAGLSDFFPDLERYPMLPVSRVIRRGMLFRQSPPVVAERTREPEVPEPLPQPPIGHRRHFCRRIPKPLEA